MIDIKGIISHARDRSYMSGVARDKLRVKATGEVFTPTHVVQSTLNHLPQEVFTDRSKTFLDPSCGDGQFLSEVLIRKIENGATLEQALSTIYGVDLMIDNVDLCRERLLCGQEHLRHIVEQNIQCRNGLTFGYTFNPMGNARRLTEDKLRQKVSKEKLKAKKREEELAKKKLKEVREKKLFW